MARHASDNRYYEDFVELCARYRTMNLPVLLKAAEAGKARCLKEKRFRPA